MKEKSFPRGGSKPAFRKSTNSSFSLFEKPRKKNKKKIKKVDSVQEENLKPDDVDRNKPLAVKYVEELGPTVAREGMLVLGIVSQVTEKVVSVSLPGSLRGVVTIPYISEFYTNMINKSQLGSEITGLKEIFQPGDVLPVKILSVSDVSNSLMVTCDPKIINSKLTYDVLEKGLILCGSVQSREEYGFIIDFGIQQVHGFLHLNKVKENMNLKVGQIIRCAVISCNKAVGSCNLQLSTLLKDFQVSYLSPTSSFPLLLFLPGFQFEVTVQKILVNGLEVTYGQENSFKGYIHEDQLLNRFPKLSQIEIHTKLTATLLYVKPMVNIPYFKIMPQKQTEWPFQYGEIVSGKVLQARRSGLIVKVSDGTRNAKCFIPISKLKNSNKLFNGDMKIEDLYPVNKRLPKIRLENCNYMTRSYKGTTDKSSLEEKYFSVSDLKCGEVVTCTISSFAEKVAYLKIGKSITGLVKFSDMTDVPVENPLSRFKVGQQVKAKVVDINVQSRYLGLTMKPTLVKEKKILTDYNFKKDENYLGVVLHVQDNKLKVKFFNFITGVLPKHLTLYPDAISLEKYFYKGQLIRCYVLEVDENNSLCLSMFQSDLNSSLKVGNKYNGVIVNKTEKGLLLDIQTSKKNNCNGYLPKDLLTMHRDLCGSLLSAYSVGDRISVYCLSKNMKLGLPVFGMLEIFPNFYEGKSSEELEKLMEVGSVLPFLFKYYHSITNKMFLRNLVPGKDEIIVEVTRDDFNDRTKVFSRHWLLYGKILDLNQKKMRVSIKLSDVWDKNYHVSLDLLDSYLETMTKLVALQKKKFQAYSENASLGRSVCGIIEEIRPRHAIVRTNDGDLGLVEGKFTKGQNITGMIVWIDGPEQMIHIVATHTSIPEEIAEGSSDTKWQKSFAKIIFVNSKVVVVQLRGQCRGKVAYLPRRRHLNDMETVECPFAVGDDVRVWVTTKNSKYLVAMDSQVVALHNKKMLENSKKKLNESIVSLKRKLLSEKTQRYEKRAKKLEVDDLQVIETRLSRKKDESNQTLENGAVEIELSEIKQEIDVDDEPYASACNGTLHLEYDDIDVKSEVEEDTRKDEIPDCRIYNEEKIALSSSSESEDEDDNKKDEESSQAFKIGFKWEALNNNALLSGVVLNKNESSSDEEEETKNEKKKRRKLTESEKIEKSKTEEQRLRLIEERLMDPNREPETVDDFDRAVLANPDSSALWLKYMAFHIQGTEIEAAKTVARRALKAISFREEQEKLNIWIALLNLENLYGNEESLNKTLFEALQYNEPYNIHLHMLNLYGKSNKLQEMEKLGNFMLKKYKDVENMWHEVGLAYFIVGKVESARVVLQRALTVLNKKQHVLLISKFAQLENKYGSPERAQTLYESILSSFPKRVDIWSCYVDMLIKSNLISLARQVLERATSQTLRPRKMKTLFKKFLTFEETHGTPEGVEKVREAAVEYVQTVGSLNKS